jgi:hypothetical protein
MNKIQMNRWLAAKALFEKLIKKAETENTVIFWQGSLIPSDSIKIRDDGIYVVLDNCTFVMFDCDPDLDEGVHAPIQEFAKDIREQFKLAKIVKF